jgi:murein DD-endopeptidase MepM/ murein hydrolase activator NlpD
VGAKFLALALCCCLPLRHIYLNSGFGYRLHPIDGKVRLHAGIDLFARHDTVFAIMDGTVTACRFDQRLGLYVRVAHAAGWQSTYGHLSQWLVLPGDSVQAGQPLGLSGATGSVTGEHLHFAISFNHQAIDPLVFFRRMVIPDTINNKQFYEQTKQ